MHGTELEQREQRLRGKNEHSLLKKTNSAHIREEESSEKQRQKVKQESTEGPHMLCQDKVFRCYPEGKVDPPKGSKLQRACVCPCAHMHAR